jgi:hypothetical protein
LPVITVPLDEKQAERVALANVDLGLKQVK